MLKQHHHSRLRSLAGSAFVCAIAALSILVAPATGASNATQQGEIATDARPIVRINPGYPKAAAEQGIEGFVEMEFTITEEGKVADIVVMESAPGETFVDSAVQALSRWRFVPEKSDGIRVPRRATQRIEFHLD